MRQLSTGIVLVMIMAAQASAAQTPRLDTGPLPRIVGERPQNRLLCPTFSSAGEWSLQGTLITPDQVIDQGVITIDGRKIAAVKATGPGPSCATKIDGIILPGLIDLHNHLTWNVHPRWQPPNLYLNRAEWRTSPQHQAAVVEPHDSLVGLDCKANLYGEVRALIGGATSSVGGANGYDYPLVPFCIAGLIRNLDYDSQFPKLSLMSGPFQVPVRDRGPCTPAGGPIQDVAVTVIFPFGAENLPPKQNVSPMSVERAAFLKCNLNSGRLRSLLVHLAEGTDQPSRDEFDQLATLGLLQKGTTIIHGTALQPQDFAEMKSRGVGLVWSPRSNMELYGATTDIAAARDAGVSVAIAPDWSPTGSDGMLQELNYARARFGAFNSQQLVMMATFVPASLARVNDRIGQLTAGLYADLVVVRRKQGSAYDSVVTASPADVQLVVVDGRPVYGDSALMQKLVPGKQLVLLTICGASKAIDLSDTIAAETSWTEVKDFSRTG